VISDTNPHFAVKGLYFIEPTIRGAFIRIITQPQNQIWILAINVIYGSLAV
jgi:hypothetical protein